MGVLNFFSSLIDSLAWPLTAVVFLCVFRSPLSKVLSGLSRVRYGELEMDFQQVIENIEDKAETAGIEVPLEREAGQEEEQNSIQIIEEAARLARVFPEPAVGWAWKAVEMELMDAADRFEIQKHYRGRGGVAVQNTRILFEKGHLNRHIYEILNEMRKLRNAAVHPERDRRHFESQEAVDYVALAKGVTDSLRSLPG